MQHNKKKTTERQVLQKKEEIIIKNNEIYKAKVEPSEGKMLPLLDDSYKKIVQETGTVAGNISNVTKVSLSNNEQSLLS